MKLLTVLGTISVKNNILEKKNRYLYTVLTVVKVYSVQNYHRAIEREF